MNCDVSLYYFFKMKEVLVWVIVIVGVENVVVCGDKFEVCF